MTEQTPSFGPLIGRDRDIAAVIDALQDTRLLTLTGPGGVGKTRLALQAVDEMRDRYSDGAFVVHLAAIPTAALVLPTIAQVLGVRESGRQSLREHVQQRVRAKQLLLVLDNFEHVVAAASEVAALLERCPQLTVMVTSRVPLNLTGERRYRVDPLVLPDPAAAPTVDVVAQAAAVQLFVQRARTVAPDFALTAANAAAVAAICRRLDGLPLAIELTAAHLTLLSLPMLMARLDVALPLLTGRAHDFAERHQTLWRTIAWSYHLLTEWERALFERLSVFASGCTLDAVDVVCRGAGDDIGDTRPIVSALADKSLVRMDERPEWGAPRLMMPETIRAYALERLAQSGEEETLRGQHARYYQALAEQAEPALMGPNQGLWVARLEQEHDNLRAILRWVLDSPAPLPLALEDAAPQVVPADRADAMAPFAAGRIALGLRLGASLWRFWHMRGYLSEGRDWLERLVARPSGDDIVTRRARAQALTGAGLLALYQGDRRRSAVLCAESLSLFENLGDRRGMAQALFGLRRLEDSVALYRELGDKQGLAEPLLDLALATFQQGDDARAMQLYEESLALSRERGDRRAIALSLGGLGMVESFRRSNYTRAAALHEESLLLYRELGDKRGIAIALNNLGEVAAMQNDYDRATDLIEGSLPLRREVGDQFGLAASLNALANVARAQGDYKRAAALHEDSVGLFRTLQDKGWLTYPLRGLADVLRLQGAYERAQALLEELQSLSEESGDKHGIAYALDGLGLVAAALGDTARARTLLEEALGLYQAMQDRAGIPHAMAHLGIVALQQGDPGRALALHRQSLALYREVGDGRGETIALCGLGDAMRAGGDMEGARVAYREVLVLSQSLGLKAEVARGLWGMAAVRSAEGHAEHGARLAGCAEALRESCAATVPPVERVVHAQDLAVLRAALGTEGFEAAWTAGRSLSLEQAITTAIGEAVLSAQSDKGQARRSL